MTRRTHRKSGCCHQDRQHHKYESFLLSAPLTHDAIVNLLQEAPSWPNRTDLNPVVANS
jgi:hypothetical protein